jgi:hypothetical protein
VCIKKWEFEFEFSPANTIRLIPVNFSQAQSTVYQTDACDSLALAPSALPVLSAETGSLAHPAPLAIVSMEVISPTISKSILAHASKLHARVQMGSRTLAVSGRSHATDARL